MNRRRGLGVFGGQQQWSSSHHLLEARLVGLSDLELGARHFFMVVGDDDFVVARVDQDGVF